jgi:formylmethanofuran dehydrogenase subunit B
MSRESEDAVHTCVPCPFCGLVCDDLEVSVSAGKVRLAANGCPRSTALFEYAAVGQALLEGEPTTVDAAVERAAEILRNASQPLIGGLASDVAGMRAALDLADRIGAVVDHMNSGALMRNLLVLQNDGWIATTFAEVRNRADFVLIVGSNIEQRFPRFFERVLPGEAMFVQGEREVVYLGEDLDPPPAPPAGIAFRAITCRQQSLAEIFAALRALLAGRELQATHLDGIPITQWQALLARMKCASYGVVVWAAADLDFPHAELTVQAITALVTELNEATRFAVLPLAGSDGDITASQVCTWQSGYAPRVSFAGDTPDYDPHRFHVETMLANGEADALLWIASFDPNRLPPQTNAAVIVLGRPGMRFATPPAVFIPVATPGLHHAGHFFRSDNVVALRLKKLTDSPLQSSADTLKRVALRL